MGDTDPDPLRGVRVDSTWDPDPAKHPEWAPWRKLAAEWSPEDALARIEKKASFVFGNVALVGTLAGGLGLITGLKVPFSLRWLALVAAGLLALALALALAAAFPSWKSSTKLNQLTALKSDYDKRIRHRGWFVRISLVAYAAALVAGIVLVWGSLTTTTVAEPSLGLALAAKNDTRVLVGTVTAQSVDVARDARTTMFAVVDGTESVLASNVTRPGSMGALTVTLTAEPAPPAQSFMLRVDYLDTSGSQVIRTIQIDR